MKFFCYLPLQLIKTARTDISVHLHDGENVSVGKKFHLLILQNFKFVALNSFINSNVHSLSSEGGFPSSLCSM